MNNEVNENVKNENEKESGLVRFWKNIPWKKTGLALLFPHGFIVFLMFNLTIAGLLYVFLNHYENTVWAVCLYTISFYTLVIVCARIPGIVKKVNARVHSNKYAHIYLTDKELRMKISMYRGLMINIPFAIFKVIMGFLYNSAWLYAMAGYNVILSIMRFVVVYRAQKKGLSEQEQRRSGLQSYRTCGWLMLILNMAISVIITMVVVDKQTISYPFILTIGLATYTFYCFTMAIINMGKYRTRNNPVYATIKRIEMAKAIVSIFTLQVAMLTSFGGQEGFDTSLLNALTGIAVVLSINTLAALMLAGVKKDFKEIT